MLTRKIQNNYTWNMATLPRLCSDEPCSDEAFLASVVELRNRRNAAVISRVEMGLQQHSNNLPSS